MMRILLLFCLSFTLTCCGQRTLGLYTVRRSNIETRESKFLHLFTAGVITANANIEDYQRLFANGNTGPYNWQTVYNSILKNQYFIDEFGHRNYIIFLKETNTYYMIKFYNCLNLSCDIGVRYCYSLTNPTANIFLYGNKEDSKQALANFKSYILPKIKILYK